jgi:metallophosphoesterase (TIGR00282 family)
MPSKHAGSPHLKILFIGDIVGQPGRDAVKHLLPGLVEEYGAHLVIANAENAAGGTGITPQVADELLDQGIDVLTTGNHFWSKREIIPELERFPTLVRPANYPPGVPGRGVCQVEADGVRVAVINLCGRIFMNPIDCPFQVADRLLAELDGKVPVIFVDMHAEATSEKYAMGWHLDGRVSAVFGTHTHVQTSDARLLNRGTAYITDVGMTGPSDSIIGMRREIILERFLTQLPQRFEVGKGRAFIEGGVCTVDRASGRAVAVESFRRAL